MPGQSTFMERIKPLIHGLLSLLETRVYAVSCLAVCCISIYLDVHGIAHTRPGTT